VTAARIRGVALPDGEPVAYAVVYDAHSYRDLGQLNTPSAVILRGRLVR
jgi:hypothetical protein